jgi:hypothetical protein
MSSVPGNEDAGELSSAPKPEVRPGTSRRKISMSVVNFWLDTFLLVVVVTLGWVSAMLRIVFPRPGKAEGWTLGGWTFDQWYDVQFLCLCILGLGVVIHVMLHWNWVIGVITNQIVKTRVRVDESMKTIYGVGLLIVLLHLIAAGIIVSMYLVKHPPA